MDYITFGQSQARYFSLFSSLSNRLLIRATYLSYRHESGINVLIQRSTRKQIIVFPKMSNYCSSHTLHSCGFSPV